MQMFSDMPANHILQMRQKEPSLLQQQETISVTAATHFSTGISIVRTVTVFCISSVFMCKSSYCFSTS